MIGLRYLLVPVLFSFVLTPRAFGQGSTLNVTIEGLAQDDQATLTAERGVGGLYDAVMTGAGESTPVMHTFSLDSGPWVLSIDAPGYMTPLAETIDVDGVVNVTLDVALLAGDSTTYTFTWEEDGSFAGHAT